MRVLVVKTSSLGDVIHALPAISDAQLQFGDDFQCDWVVEQPFAEIPSWHPAVDTVIPVAIRQWRKNWLTSLSKIRRCLKRIRATRYDAIIDAQGLWKSAIITRLARGPRHGFAKGDSRESVQSAYQHTHSVARNQHAVTRVRQLFADSLGYAMPDTAPNYGIRHHFAAAKTNTPYIVLIHGTSWDSKLWPLSYWRALTELVISQGYQVKILQGSNLELARANEIANGINSANVMTKMSLSAIAELLAGSSGAIAVDTGIGHLACALETPCISLYGATDATRTGTLGNQQIHLQADFACSPCLLRQCNHPDHHQPITPPCFKAITPEQAWASLTPLLS